MLCKDALPGWSADSVLRGDTAGSAPRCTGDAPRAASASRPGGAPAWEAGATNRPVTSKKSSAETNRVIGGIASP
ncbi:hypothetical protein GMLC_34230 [Geomonas limicola]|uniref:Uncharacterized protein n=1 Tax=Geomonas limicola TaxID=2740186 RepID=A0A6V8NDF1_9BACT|nr:hypothetical protein GMLC_34230 [Geomonas limicola]